MAEEPDFETANKSDRSREVEKVIKKRKWVKHVIVIFVILILVYVVYANWSMIFPKNEIIDVVGEPRKTVVEEPNETENLSQNENIIQKIELPLPKISLKKICRDLCGADLIATVHHEEEKILECDCRHMVRYYWDLDKDEELSSNKAASILGTWADNALNK